MTIWLSRVLTATLVCLAAPIVAGHDRQTGPSQKTRVPAAEMFAVSDLTMDPQFDVSVWGRVRKLDPKLFPASFYSRSPTQGLCTSTVVGPRVLLTAAHCVSQGGTVELRRGADVFTAVCTQAPDFLPPRRNATADYALCLFADALDSMPFFEIVNTDPTLLKKNASVLLTGFGCTKKGGGGVDGVLLGGEVSIDSIPSRSNNQVVTKGDVGSCVGDSGGPTYRQEGGDGSARVQLSINSNTSNGSKSFLSSLSTPTALDFMRKWSAQHNVTICGIHAGAPKCGVQP